MFWPRREGAMLFGMVYPTSIFRNDL